MGGIKTLGFDRRARGRRRPDRAASRRASSTSRTCSTPSSSSALVQEPTGSQIIPVRGRRSAHVGDLPTTADAAVEYEPDEEAILADLLPRNVAIQVFRAMLENAASEQGSRMNAMDNATSNAGDMIKRLSIQYNRTRQAAITTELVEIISGAEAL